MLLLYFCLFAGQVNKNIIFVFGVFVHHFKKSISIFVKILKNYMSDANYLSKCTALVVAVFAEKGKGTKLAHSRCGLISSVSAY